MCRQQPLVAIVRHGDPLRREVLRTQLLGPTCAPERSLDKYEVFATHSLPLSNGSTTSVSVYDVPGSIRLMEHLAHVCDAVVIVCETVKARGEPFWSAATALAMAAAVRCRRSGQPALLLGILDVAAGNGAAQAAAHEGVADGSTDTPLPPPPAPSSNSSHAEVARKQFEAAVRQSVSLGRLVVPASSTSPPSSFALFGDSGVASLRSWLSKELSNEPAPAAAAAAPSQRPLRFLVLIPHTTSASGCGMVVRILDGELKGGQPVVLTQCPATDHCFVRELSRYPDGAPLSRAGAGAMVTIVLTPVVTSESVPARIVRRFDLGGSASALSQMPLPVASMLLEIPLSSVAAANPPVSAWQNLTVSVHGYGSIAYGRLGLLRVDDHSRRLLLSFHVGARAQDGAAPALSGLGLLHASAAIALDSPVRCLDDTAPDTPCVVLTIEGSRATKQRASRSFVAVVRRHSLAFGPHVACVVEERARNGGNAAPQTDCDGAVDLLARLCAYPPFFDGRQVDALLKSTRSAESADDTATDGTEKAAWERLAAVEALRAFWCDVPAGLAILLREKKIHESAVAAAGSGAAATVSFRALRAAPRPTTLSELLLRGFVPPQRVKPTRLGMVPPPSPEVRVAAWSWGNALRQWLMDQVDYVDPHGEGLLPSLRVGYVRRGTEHAGPAWNSAAVMRAVAAERGAPDATFFAAAAAAHSGTVGPWSHRDPIALQSTLMHEGLFYPPEAAVIPRAIEQCIDAFVRPSPSPPSPQALFQLLSAPEAVVCSATVGWLRRQDAEERVLRAVLRWAGSPVVSDGAPASRGELDRALQHLDTHLPLCVVLRRYVARWHLQRCVRSSAHVVEWILSYAFRSFTPL